MEEAGIYRSICIQQALYKLFSTLLYNRLYPRLDCEQPEEQGGFRRSYRTLDHFATYRLLEQKCRELGVKVWVATVHFMKACVSRSHKSPWSALEQCGVEPPYISLWRRLFAEQKATVTDKESDVFKIKTRKKQGDPLSSLLFNTVLQVALEDHLVRWQKKGMGIRLGDSASDCLTHLRFANDVL